MERKYFSMAYVCRRFGVNASAIRFWIDEFDLKVKQGDRNFRYFTWENVEEIADIYYLLKVRKYTTEGARQELEPIRLRQEMNNMLRVF